MTGSARLVEFASRVRGCPDCCPAERALAAALLEGPDAVGLETCPFCRHPKLTGEPCPCEQHLGRPANPGSARPAETREPRLVALLSWYDESPSLLDLAVRSAAAAGAAAVVALDGAYALYPGGRAASPLAQRDAVYRAAAGAGIDATVVVPSRVWASEVEKRSRLFRLAEPLAADWLLVLDADYEIRADRAVLLAALAETDCLVAEVRLWTPAGPGGDSTLGLPEDSTIRALFRAVPGLHVQGNHFTYVDQVGRRLWGSRAQGPLAAAADLTATAAIVHRTYHRDRDRVGAQYGYYRARDAAGIEAGDCLRCRERPATVAVPAGFRDHDGVVSATWIEVCGDCAPQATADGETEAAQLGLAAAFARQTIQLGSR